MSIHLTTHAGLVPLTAAVVTTPALTLARVITIDPSIGTLLQRARCVPRASWRTYERLQAELSRYVGWGAADPRLASSRAYELAISALVEALDL